MTAQGHLPFPVLKESTETLSGELGCAYFYPPLPGEARWSAGRWVLDLPTYQGNTSGVFVAHLATPDLSEAEYVLYVDELQAAEGKVLQALDLSTFGDEVEGLLEIPVFDVDERPLPAADHALRQIVYALLDGRLRLNSEWYEATSEETLEDLLQDLMGGGVCA